MAVAELLEGHRTPGAAIGVVEGEGRHTVVAAGRRGDGRGPVEDDTLFAAASLTKPVFAAGVMAGSTGETGVPVGSPIACVGLEARGPGEAKVTALAVAPDWRRQGIATSLVQGACQRLELHALDADTHGDAAEFFRAIGFHFDSRAGRSRCRLELSED